MPALENLEPRLVLTSLASTFVAGGSVNQTLSNVVNNTALGGLMVASISGFNTAPPTSYVLLGTKNDLTKVVTNFGLVAYSAQATNSFTTLALPEGDGSVILKDTTIVSQAPNAVTGASAQSLSKNPFTLDVTTPENGFASSGYLYVEAQHGHYVVQYASESTAGLVTSFAGCMIVGAFGQISANPFSDTVGAGATIVQSIAPTPGQTTSINPTAITVTANSAPINIPVISTAGFTNPGTTLVYYNDGSLGFIDYTGITTNPDGGSLLTGCTTQTGGTLGAFGQVAKGPTANVQWTSTAPISFSFTNNSAEAKVYVAIAGQQINTLNQNASTYGYLAPVYTNGQIDFTQPWTFQPLPSTGNVPTYAIFDAGSLQGAKQTILIPNNPKARLDSVRMVFSVGTPPVIPIISGKPSFPASGNSGDPNNAINYDFTEFTERSSPNDGILFINTTQVDQVGIPFTMQTTPVDSVKSNGVGITVSRPDMFNAYTNYIRQQFSFNPIPGAPLAESAFLSLTTPYRLLNPSDAISNPPSNAASAFNTYFDAALTKFFNDYTTTGQTFRLQRDGAYFSGQTIQNFTPAPYSTSATSTGSGVLQIPPNGSNPTSLTFSIGELVSGPGITGTAKITNISVDTNSQVTNLTIDQNAAAGQGTFSFQVPGQFTVLQLKETDSNWTVVPGGQQYQIYAPYFAQGTSYPANFPGTAPAPVAPPWISQTGKPASAGKMVFGNLGAFADGGAQAADGQISGTGATGQILLDIENTIVSAFNRGVANSVAPANDVTSTWNNNALFYPEPDLTGANWSNLYAGFLHNAGVSITAPGSNVGLAYGFAYDDQGGNDPTLTSYASTVAITLNPLVTAPKTLVHFAAVPTGIKTAPKTDILQFAVKGAIPKTEYAVVVYQHTKSGDKKVGKTIMIKSDAHGRLHTSLKSIIRLRPGQYRVLVEDLLNTFSAILSKVFRLR